MASIVQLMTGMARFLLNAMLASGGYAWTIIPVNMRDEYMKALEKASVYGDITDFTQLIAALVKGQDNTERKG